MIIPIITNNSSIGEAAWQQSGIKVHNDSQQYGITRYY